MYLPVFFLIVLFFHSSQQATCPSDAIPSHDGKHCLISFYTYTYDWLNAEYYCQHYENEFVNYDNDTIGKNFQLASIHDAFTNKQLKPYLYGLLGQWTHYWIGASTIFSKNGSWGWWDGSAWDYTNWAPGQPLGYGGVACTYINATDGYWYTDFCSSEYNILCEYTLAKK